MRSDEDRLVKPFYHDMCCTNGVQPGSSPRRWNISLDGCTWRHPTGTDVASSRCTRSRQPCALSGATRQRDSDVRADGPALASACGGARLRSNEVTACLTVVRNVRSCPMSAGVRCRRRLDPQDAPGSPNASMPAATWKRAEPSMNTTSARSGASPLRSAAVQSDELSKLADFSGHRRRPNRRCWTSRLAWCCSASSMPQALFAVHRSPGDACTRT